MYVAFDIGQVLCHCDMDKYFKGLYQLDNENYPFHRGFSKEAAISFIEIHRSIEKQDYVGMIDRHKHFSNKLNLKQQYSERLPDLWNSIVYPNDQMMNFLVRLRDTGVKIALLSNMGPDHAKYLREKYPEIFENTIQHLSFEVGTFKPSKLFYQSFLLSNEEFAGCLYLDDLKENLIIGAKMKFNATHFDLRDFKKPIELKKRLNELFDKITKGI